MPDQTDRSEPSCPFRNRAPEAPFLPGLPRSSLLTAETRSPRDSLPVRPLRALRALCGETFRACLFSQPITWSTPGSPLSSSRSSPPWASLSSDSPRPSPATARQPTARSGRPLARNHRARQPWPQLPLLLFLPLLLPFQPKVCSPSPHRAKAISESHPCGRGPQATRNPRNLLRLTGLLTPR